MSKAKAALAVLFAPLVGASIWLGQTIVRSTTLAEELDDPSFSLASGLAHDPMGAVQILGIGWLYGLVLTIVIGLPLGFGIAFAMKKLGMEGAVHYPAAGALTAFLFSMLLPGRTEFWPAVTVTGLLLGTAFWFFVRRPALNLPDTSHD